MNGFTELILRCNDFVDYRNTALKDIDLALVATNATGSKKFPFKTDIVNNPER